MSQIAGGIDEFEELCSLELSIHEIKHVLDWFKEYTGTVGTTDCEDSIAQQLADLIGDESAIGFFCGELPHGLEFKSVVCRQEIHVVDLIQCLQEYLRKFDPNSDSDDWKISIKEINSLIAGKGSIKEEKKLESFLFSKRFWQFVSVLCLILSFLLLISIILR